MLQFAPATRFIVVDEYRPVRDRDRNQRTTEDGRPLLYVAALVIGGSKKPLTIRVKVPAPKPVPLGSPAAFDGLVGSLYEIDGKQGVSFTADAVKAVA